MLQVGAKYVRVQVRKSGGDMRRLVDHRTLFKTRRETLQDECRDQNSGQQEMVPGGTMCERHRPHRNTQTGDRGPRSYSTSTSYTNSALDRKSTRLNSSHLGIS